VGAGSVSSAMTGFVAIIVGGVLMVILYPTLMHQMEVRLNGGVPDLSTSAKFGSRMFFRMVWGWFLATLGLMGAMMVVGVAVVLVAGLSAAFLGDGVLSGILMVVVGAAVFFTVGVWAMAGISLFLPGIVVERLTAIESLRRGFALAKGGRFRIVAVLFVAWLLIIIPVMAIYAVTGTLGMLTDPVAAAAGGVSGGRIVTQQVMALGVSAFTTPLFVACFLLVYYDQRIRSEAFDVEAAVDELVS
ncbi:MAG: hypothetical protein OEZ65_13860, partial [Gemmatimonadota bacterium]|nr:hypothetical protein [Gemmatimonadota bacterium]